MSEIDSVLSGVIIILLIVVLWKWHGGSSCGQTPKRYPAPYHRMPSCQMRDTMERFSEEARHGVKHVVGSGPQLPDSPETASDYQDAVKKMALETGVDESHKRYCDSLSFAGMPTGSSACTLLEETGRSYGTADYVGLTARKFCKARQLATPADDARVTPSYDVIEWCNVDMDELV